MDYRKIDDHTIEITIQPETPAPIIEVYGDRAFLEQQLIDIQAQWDQQIVDINKTRQAELDQIKIILQEMDILGIVAIADIISTPPQPAPVELTTSIT